MEQPDQSVVRSTVKVSTETLSSVSKTRSKGVDSVAERKLEQDPNQKITLVRLRRTRR